MGRGRKPLNAQQQAALRAVAKADADWRNAKRTAIEEARRRADEAVRQVSDARDRAIYAAVKLGVPKTQIATREILGTTNPWAVSEAVVRVNEYVADHGEPDEVNVEVSRFSWGEIYAANSEWVYGWVIDAADPVETTSPIDKARTHPGYWVVVDIRQSGTSLTREGMLYTMGDGEFEELREWAVAHAGEVEPTQ